MPNPSELERQRQEELDPRINADEPITITFSRGALRSTLRIDPLMFDRMHHPEAMLAEMAAIFVKHMRKD